MSDTTVTESVSYSELLTGLKAAAEAMKREIMLGRDTQRLMFALGDTQRLVRRAEAMLNRMDKPAQAPEVGFALLLEQIGVRQ